MAKTKRMQALHTSKNGKAAVLGLAGCLLGGSAGCLALLALFALLLPKHPSRWQRHDLWGVWRQRQGPEYRVICWPEK